MKKIFTFLFVSILTISCYDNAIDNFELYPGLEHNDISWSSTPIELTKTSAMFNDVISDSKPHQFNTNLGSTWVFNQNTQIILPANAYINKAGASINGQITASITSVIKKGDYIRNLLPSITSTNIIEYGSSSFYITLLTNGLDEVKLKAGYFITINSKDSTASNSHKLSFTEVPTPLNNDSPIRWITSTTTTEGSLQLEAVLPITATGSRMGFSIKTNKTATYLTAAKTNYIPSSSSRLDVIMPANFTNKNTIVFAVFENKNIILRLNPDALNKCYCYAQMPIGEKVKLVSVSLIDNKIYYGVNEVITKSNEVYKVSPFNQPFTKEQLRNYLDLL